MWHCTHRTQLDAAQQQGLEMDKERVMLGLKVLRRARERYRRRDSWTQGSYALDKYGCPVAFRSGYAVCFCLDGNLNLSSGPDSNRGYGAAADLLYESGAIPKGVHFVEWNDSIFRTKREVTHALEKAGEYGQQLLAA